MDPAAALLALLVAQDKLLTVIAAAAGLLGLPSALGSLLVYGLLTWAVAVALPVVFSRAGALAVVMGGAWLAAFAVGALIGRGSAQFYITIAIGLLVGLGWMAVAFAVRDYRLCRRYLYASAPVILLAALMDLWSASGEVVTDAGYSQDIAYRALPAVLIFIDAAFSNRRVLNGALATASTFVMVSAGARGPLVIAALFLVARLVLHVRASPRTAIMIAWVGALAIWVVMQSYLTILSSLTAALERAGLSTRAIENLLAGTLFEDRARSDLRENTFDIIDQHPFTGVGISNERPILAQLMGASAETESFGWYPHNIFLELWAQFGIVLGTLLVVLLMHAVLRALVGADDLDYRYLVLIFVGLGLIPLMFSASYLSWAPFFGLVGLCLQRRHASLRRTV